MTGPTGWELWYADSGNPKSGTRKATGTIPALDAGQEYAIYTASQGSGNYMFKAYQRPGHPGTGVLWSKAIEFDIGACSN
jgi:YqxM protein